MSNFSSERQQYSSSSEQQHAYISSFYEQIRELYRSLGSRVGQTEAAVDNSTIRDTVDTIALLHRRILDAMENTKGIAQRLRSSATVPPGMKEQAESAQIMARQVLDVLNSFGTQLTSILEQSESPTQPERKKSPLQTHLDRLRVLQTMLTGLQFVPFAATALPTTPTAIVRDVRGGDFSESHGLEMPVCDIFNPRIVKDISKVLAVAEACGLNLPPDASVDVPNGQVPENLRITKFDLPTMNPERRPSLTLAPLGYPFQSTSSPEIMNAVESAVAASTDPSLRNINVLNALAALEQQQNPDGSPKYPDIQNFQAYYNNAAYTAQEITKRYPQLNGNLEVSTMTMKLADRLYVIFIATTTKDVTISEGELAGNYKAGSRVFLYSPRNGESALYILNDCNGLDASDLAMVIPVSPDYSVIGRVVEGEKGIFYLVEILNTEQRPDTQSVGVELLPVMSGITTKKANFRDGASMQSKTLFTIDANQEVTVVRKTGDWYDVILKAGTRVTYSNGKAAILDQETRGNLHTSVMTADASVAEMLGIHPFNMTGKDVPGMIQTAVAESIVGSTTGEVETDPEASVEDLGVLNEIVQNSEVSLESAGITIRLHNSWDIISERAKKGMIENIVPEFSVVREKDLRILRESIAWAGAHTNLSFDEFLKARKNGQIFTWETYIRDTNTGKGKLFKIPLGKVEFTGTYESGTLEIISSDTPEIEFIFATDQLAEKFYLSYGAQIGGKSLVITDRADVFANADDINKIIIVSSVSPDPSVFWQPGEEKYWGGVDDGIADFPMLSIFNLAILSTLPTSDQKAAVDTAINDLLKLKSFINSPLRPYYKNLLLGFKPDGSRLPPAIDVKPKPFS